MTKQNNAVTITTAVGECNFTIPKEFPASIYLDVYGKSYRIIADGRIFEQTKEGEIELIKEEGAK